MSETLRDLVVSLSLQTDNFTRNIKSVSKQIAEAESQFNWLLPVWRASSAPPQALPPSFPRWSAACL